MKNTASIIFIAFMVLISPISAKIGSQSFADINYSDDTLTDAEIEAAETTFSDPGLLPDNPFYFLKRAAEGIRLFLTFDKESKARLHLDFAKTRLAEAKKLADEKKIEGVKNSLTEFNKELNEFETASKAMGKDISGLVRESENVLQKSRIVLGLVSEKVPESAKLAIEQAINNSIVKEVNIEIGDRKDKAAAEERIKKEIEKSADIQKQIKEMIKEKEAAKDIDAPETPSRICIQVITPARNPKTGECRDFPTPCDVPEGWERTDSCDDGLGVPGLSIGIA